MRTMNFPLLMCAELLLHSASKQTDDLLTDDLSEENLGCTGLPEFGQYRYLSMRDTGNQSF